MNKAPLTISDTKKMAENLMSEIHRGDRKHALVIGLFGDLGSGKTTFMQFLGASLGIKDKILSPTFVIEKIYKIDHENFDHLIHIDAYRVDDEKELVTLGWSEISRNPRNIICIEWADKVLGLLPKDLVRLKFSHHDEESRLISLEQ